MNGFSRTKYGFMSQHSLDEWFAQILSKDPMTFEDAYWSDRPPAEEVVPKVIQALSVVLDSYTRGKLLELLGECEDASVLPILERELESSDASIRNWAKISIEALNRREPWQKSQKYL